MDFLNNKNKRLENHFHGTGKSGRLMLAILLVSVMLSLTVISSSARFVTNANGNSSAGVAKPVFEVEFGATQLSFSETVDGYFCFNVTNSNKGEISQTSMSYSIILTSISQTVSTVPGALYSCSDGSYNDKNLILQAPSVIQMDGQTQYTYQLTAMQFGIGTAQKAFYSIGFLANESGNAQYKIEVIAQQID